MSASVGSMDVKPAPFEASQILMMWRSEEMTLCVRYVHSDMSIGLHLSISLCLPASSSKQQTAKHIEAGHWRGKDRQRASIR